jgi:zona occludens toxin
VIYLVTGLPGHGKSYFTVARAPELLAHPGRQFYYSGINELQLPWEPCEPETWYNLPDGSAVIIDEAQRLFRPMPPGAQRPRCVTELETHRHRGFDIWLITQDAGLLDSHVRRLVGKHFHVHRPFGLKAFNWWSWEKIEDPNDWHARKRAVTGRLPIKREIYRLYKSAELHTVKARLPWKLFLLPVAVAAVGIFAYLGYSTLKGSTEAKKSPVPDGVKLTPMQELPPARFKTLQRIEAALPPHRDLPHFAERYEGLTQPKAVPVVRGCFTNLAVTPTRCWCVSQRGTRMDVSREFCEEFINRGRPFYDFEPDEGIDVDTARPSRSPPAMLPAAASAAGPQGDSKPPSPLQTLSR